MHDSIRDSEPTTSCLRYNSYHLHIPLYVLDVIRIFQDHPKFCKGLKDMNIIEMLKKEPIACGDVEAQVKTALRELTSSGFVRYIRQGYRTLGPFAKLALARTPRQFNAAWNKLSELQKISTTTLTSTSSSSHSNLC